MYTPTAAPVVRVVIVSYNTADLLVACLHSLQACRLPLQVVVVDNASADDSVRRARQVAPTAEVVALPRNVGFAAANNMGIRLLRGAGRTASMPLPPFVLLLNPDTVVQPGAIELLVAFLQAHPRVGMVAPRLLNPDGSIQSGAFRFPTLSMSLLDMFPPGEVLPGRLHNSWWHGRYPAERAVPPRPFPIDHPLGACMLVRRAVANEVGLLDEGYFMYSEEVEWCWRIRQAGWAIWQVPQAQVVHVGGAATGQVRPRMLVALHRSRERFLQQHRPRQLALHRAITRAGMLRLTLRDWWQYARRRLARDTLRANLWSYGQVAHPPAASFDAPARNRHNNGQQAVTAIRK